MMDLYGGMVLFGIRLPYAITGASVEYYSNLIRLYRLGDFGTAETIPNITADFRYDANIKYYDSFTAENDETYSGVYVISLSLKWSSYCGSLCALWFTKERTIIINDKNKFVYIIGDGYAEVAVS